MLHLRSSFMVVLAFMMLKVNTGYSQTLIHYWNFNRLPAGNLTIVNSDYTVNPGSSTIEYAGSGSGYMDLVDEGSAINVRKSAPAGAGIRPRNPSDTRNFIVSASTVGYKSIVIQFATTRTNNGATEQNYQYSIDGGTNWMNTGLSINHFAPLLEPTYSLVTVSLTNALAEDNPYFQFRISFGGTAASGSSGNNRFDNISIEGAKLVPDIDSVPPAVTFTPANGTDKIAINVNPTITFNEDVRLTDNSPLTNTNVLSLIDLKKEDAAGISIPFTATVTGKIIKIIPSSDLAYDQQVYIGLKANSIEDMSDNAIHSIQSATFKTIPMPTGVNELMPGNQVKVFPNPNNTGMLYLSAIADISVYDILGNRVLSSTGSKEIRIEHLRKGIYYVQAGKGQPVKFIIN